MVRHQILIPLLKDLGLIAEEKTEQAVVRVTDDIFKISAKSGDLGVQISKILEETFMGNEGLNESAKSLSGVTTTIDSLNRNFASMSGEFGTITAGFNTKMKEISSYLSNIVDLSEETNLLAINTAIEAARMGARAGGFSVISKSIQELSGKSRKIAGTIEKMIKNVDSILEKSFNSFHSSALEFGKSFDGINLDLDRIVNNIHREIGIVEGSIRETKDLPEIIKNDLHSIIEELQFQDITRQIQQHIVEAVEDLLALNSKNYNEAAAMGQINREELYREIVDKISKHFTVAEEWAAVGMSISETEEESDITLF